ncbi:oocyte zinc finger protein XlCOF7.1-like [Hyperolius riggenbachi]|uniref:oocyte zinc finger protein XlCOF7.1-like n=1 Tax=Hyperolius riggenbachi TaxID=752182 RepID=UPI0035A3C582
MANSQKKNHGRDKMTETILSLTLEMIYLLTGEDYMMVKKTSGDQVTPTTCRRRKQSPIMKPPPKTLINEQNKSKKILKVADKMIELLTGKVPIRCQDVSVYFSIEEWEYMEGHKDLYQEVMMENQPPLTLQDGSSHQNSPDKYTVPLYLRNSVKEDHMILQDYQEDGCSYEIPEERCPSPSYSHDSSGKDGKAAQYVHVDKTSKRMPPQACPDPPYSWEPVKEHQLRSKDYWLDGSTHKLPKQKCASVIYCQDTINDNYVTSHDNHVQGPNGRNLPNISTGPHYPWLSAKKPQKLSKDYKADGCNNNISKAGSPSSLYSQGNVEEQHKAPQKDHKDGSSNRNPPESSIGPLYSQNSEEDRLIPQDSAPKHNEIPQYYQAEETESLQEKQGDHSMSQENHDEDVYIIKVEDTDEEEPYVMGDKPRKGVEILVEISKDGQYRRHKNKKHPIIPTNKESGLNKPTENLIVPDLQPVFPQSDLPFVPLALSRPFPDPFAQHVHDEEEIFLCFECGKSFNKQSSLDRHRQLMHTWEKPYSCSDCGKRFGHKISLVRHQRIHNNENTFSCPLCQRCFAQKSHLVEHERQHTGEKPYTCGECGKRFAVKRALVSHEATHVGQKLFSCLECGKVFSRKSYLFSHQRIHLRQKVF